MKEKVEGVLDILREYLQADGGDVELVEVAENEGVVKVKLVGACGHCGMASATLHQVIEQYLKKYIPEVKEVVAIAE